MKLEQANAIVQAVVGAAAAPVSVFVADGHGELVAAATMDGAAPDTRLNAQRKAYTAARSDALSTRALADKVRGEPGELASFDPFFTFFRAALRRSRASAGSARSGSAALRAPMTMPWRAARSRRPVSGRALAEGARGPNGARSTLPGA